MVATRATPSAVEGRVEDARGGQPCGEEGGACGAAALDRRRQRDPAVGQHEHVARAARERRRRWSRPRRRCRNRGRACRRRAAASRARRGATSSGSGPSRPARARPRSATPSPRAARPRGPTTATPSEPKFASRLPPGCSRATARRSDAAERHRARDEDAPVAEQRDGARCRARVAPAKRRWSAGRCR